MPELLSRVLLAVPASIPPNGIVAADVAVPVAGFHRAGAV